MSYVRSPVSLLWFVFELFVFELSVRAVCSLPHATGVYPGRASFVAQVGQARLAAGERSAPAAAAIASVHLVTSNSAAVAWPCRGTSRTAGHGWRPSRSWWKNDRQSFRS